MADEFRVFISAVTSEFGTARSALAADLRKRGAVVSVQSEFTQGGNADTLLERLHDYIRDCNAVVCVIGTRSGATPPKVSAARHAKFLPDGISNASYTQWEYFFARYYGRRLYRYISTRDWVPDEANPTGRDALQAAFIEFVKAQGGHREPFSKAEDLRIAVLSEPWPKPLPDDPKPKPKPIVLPYPSLGSLFKGREVFMQQLHESLSRGGQTAITSKALYGLGGIGKTRAAVEYAWAHRDDYTALLFAVAETPEALRRNLAALSSTLLPNLDTTDDTVRLQAVLDWLAINPGWFLILDNVDAKDALAEAGVLLAKLSGGRLVITSRLANFSANFEPLALDVLTADDAATFLLDRTKGRRRNALNDEAKAREVAVELDGLALALEHAGAYIAKHKLTFNDYLERWRSAQHDSVLNWFDEETVTAYPRAVAVTWQTSVAQLTEPGRHLLERLAWFAPEKVPELLFDIPIPDTEADNQYDALADLAAYSLVTLDAEGPYFLVHRLVQDVTRRSLTDDLCRQRLTEALKWIGAAFPKDPSYARSWLSADALAAHASAVVAKADDAAISEPTDELMIHLGSFLESRALYKEVEPLYRRVLERGQALGQTHAAVGTSLNCLAGLYLKQGRYVEAEPLYLRALAIREEALGKNNVHVATSLNDLAALYKEQRRYTEAEPLYQRSLAIYEEALGDDHVWLGAPLNNLANLYKSLGRSAEAGPLYQRALAIFEKALGSDHHLVGESLNNLALLYQLQGRYAEAEPVFQRSLTIYEKTLGHDHPTVGTSLNNLAALYEAQGLNAEAEPLYRRAIGIFKEISRQMSRLHPNLEVVVDNYIRFLAHTGKAEVEAERHRLMRWQD